MVTTQTSGLTHSDGVALIASLFIPLVGFIFFIYYLIKQRAAVAILFAAVSLVPSCLGMGLLSFFGFLLFLPWGGH